MDRLEKDKELAVNLKVSETGVMEATKGAREFRAMMERVALEAKSQEFENVEHQVEEMLQTGILLPSGVRQVYEDVRGE